MTAAGVVRLADGLYGQPVVDATLPPRLDALLHGLQNVSQRRDVRVRGTTADCAATDHRDEKWMRGYYGWIEVQLLRCADCGRVEVRDVSLDVLHGLGKQPTLLRRDKVIGWYSGRRRAGRTYL